MTTPNFSQPAIFSEVSTPTAPDSGYLKVYANSGTLCSIANGGSEKTYAVSSDLSSYLPLAGGTLVGDLKFTDATYDIGKDGATRPRDGFFSRNLTVSTAGQGATTNTSLRVGLSSATVGGISFLSADPAAGSYITYDDAGQTKLSIGTRYSGSGSIGFFLGGAESLTLKAGSLGVGETTPIAKLDVAGDIVTRNSTTPTIFQLHNTYTSATSFENLQFKAVTGGAYQIGSAIGSAGGTNRSIEIGHYNSAGTFQPYLQSLTSGDVRFINSSSQYISINGSNQGASNPLISSSSGCRLKIHGAGDGLHISSTTVTFNHELDSSLTHQGRITAANGSFSVLALAGRPFTISDYSDGNGNVASAIITVTGGNASQSQLGTNPQGNNLVLRGGHGCPLATVTNAYGGNVVLYGGTGYGTGVGGGVLVSQPISTAGSPTAFTVTDAAHTTMAASTEATSVNFNLSSTKQFATGALTTQRAMRIQAPTYSFVGASTITTASTLSISGAPVAGTNATITNAYALNVESGQSFFGGKITAPATGQASTGGIGNGNNGIDFYNGVLFYLNVSGSATYPAWCTVASSIPRFKLASNCLLAWGDNVDASSAAGHDLGLARDAAGILAQRNSTNAQTFRVYNTYTSATSYELLEIRGVASNNFEIGPENGSAGGTLRGLTLGGYSGGSSTITPWLTFTNAGAATFNVGSLTLTSSGTGLFIQNGHIWLDSWGTHAGIRSRRANGTSGSPTQITSGNLMGFYSVSGWHDGGAYHSAHAGFIGFYATENYTSTAQGCRMVLSTTPNGTTTLTTVLEISQSGVSTFSKLVGQSAAEITSTPSGTTQTITLNNGNHQTLALTSSTGSVTVTLTVPSNVSSGTIIVKQHASTPRGITWAVSAGTVRWMGTQPTWSSDAASAVRIVSWRYDGSVMYLMSTDVAA